MATCAINKVLSDAFIVTLYPEIAGIEAFMDSLAALGRSVFVVTLDDNDHASAVKAQLDSDLTGLGYTVAIGVGNVTIACS